MAPPPPPPKLDLIRIGLEGFDLIDKFYGQPAGRRRQRGWEVQVQVPIKDDELGDRASSVATPILSQPWQLAGRRIQQRWMVDEFGNPMVSTISEPRTLLELLQSSEAWPSVQLASQKLGEAKEATTSIKLSEINKLQLDELPNFKSFSTGDIVECPFLEHVIVNHCPNLKKFGLGSIKNSQLKSVILENEAQVDDIDAKVDHLFDLLDELSTITTYNIGDGKKLAKAMDNLRPSHFTNLLLFSAKGCNEMLNKFLSILMKRSKRLQDISIEQCKTLTHLFNLNELNPDEDGHGKYFTQIKRLIFIELHQLICIWNKDPTGIFGLTNLQIMHINSCSSLKYLFTASTAERLHQLNELKLEACEKLEQVIHSGTIETIRFPSLSKVEFKSLSRFTCFYFYHIEIPNLKTLIIEKCPQLKEFTNGFATTNEMHITDGKSFSELNEVMLDSCDKIVCVVSSNTLHELKNLKKLIVGHCKALKMVFNIHGEVFDSTKLLQQLDQLVLIDLPKLTHIINKEEETIEKITFSKLKSVFLGNLPNLSIVFPFRSEFPSLEALKITNCPALMTFVEDSNQRKDILESTTSDYFFPNSLSLERLKVLYINHDVQKLWDSNSPSKSFCELENLTLSNKKLLSVISSCMIIRFNNLKILTLEKCESLIEVFNLEDDKLDPNIQVMLPQLSTLALSNLSSLTCISNKEPQVPFSPNLVYLSIVHCGTLKSLFSLSSFKNLGKLKSLKLCNCEKIEDITFGEKDQNVSITFPELECLVLKDLPKLVSFCPQNGNFYWPKLQTVRANNIPSMKIFSRGNLTTPLLKSVHITFVKKVWRGNLNKTLSYMHNNPGEF